VPESILEFFPIIFGIFGGIFVWYILKNRNPKKAKFLLKGGALFTTIVVGVFVFALMYGTFSADNIYDGKHIPPTTGSDFTGIWEGPVKGDFVYISQTGLNHCLYNANLVVEFVQNVNKLEGIVYGTDMIISENCKDSKNPLYAFVMEAIVSESSISHDGKVGGYTFSATLGDDDILRGKFGNSLPPPKSVGETSDITGDFSLTYVGENVLLSTNSTK
jgi:amino acid transporter